MAARKKQNGEKSQSELVAKQNIYSMGSSGGSRVEAYHREPRPPYLRLYKWWDNGRSHASFRFNKESDWLKAKRLVDRDLASHLGWSGHELAEDVLGESKEKVKDFEKQLEEKDKEMKALWQENRKLLEEVSRRRRSIERKLMKRYASNIPQYREELAEFKRLLSASKKEQELHTFLREHTWIFDPVYKSAKSEVRIGFASRSDFLLERTDGFVDVVELKRSNHKILNGNRLSAVTKNAISQMINYLFTADYLYNDLKVVSNIDALKPTGIIVIGRTGDKEMMQNLRLHNFYLNHIKVISYDELYQTAEQSIIKFGGAI